MPPKVQTSYEDLYCCIKHLPISFLRPILTVFFSKTGETGDINRKSIS